MPTYNFRCCKCKKMIKKLMTVEAYRALRPAEVVACDCGYTAKREMGAPSSKAMEVLDNGLMARRVERLADSERIIQERSAQHTRDHSDQLDTEE